MSPLNVLGRSGVPKTSHVMKYAGRGGVEFRVCRAVIVAVVPASTEGCRGWASNYMVVDVGFQRALLDTACIQSPHCSNYRFASMDAYRSNSLGNVWMVLLQD